MPIAQYPVIEHHLRLCSLKAIEECHEGQREVFELVLGHEQ